MRTETRALLLILAVLCALVGATLLATAPDAPAGDVGGRCRVERNGVPFCACAQMRDGVYTAAHCLSDYPPLSALTVNGTAVPAYGLDPVRDLAHIPVLADPTVVYGDPTDTAQWYGLRQGHAVLRGTGETGGPYDLRRGIHINRQTWDRWCYARPAHWYPSLPGVPRLGDGESAIDYGDSGAGFYDEAGRLVGILSLFDDGGCSAWTVRVP